MDVRLRVTRGAGSVKLEARRGVEAVCGSVWVCFRRSSRACWSIRRQIATFRQLQASSVTMGVCCSCGPYELFPSASCQRPVIHETDSARSGLALLGVGSAAGSAAHSFVNSAPDCVLRLILAFSGGKTLVNVCCVL
jgi:hypothetical protein